MDVVSRKLAYGRLLLHIGKAKFAASHWRRNIVEGCLLPAGPLEERPSWQRLSGKGTLSKFLLCYIRRK